MKSNGKKALAILLTLAMLLSLSVTALATDDELTVYYASSKTVDTQFPVTTLVHPDDWDSTNETTLGRYYSQSFYTYKPNKPQQKEAGVTYSWESSNNSVARFVQYDDESKNRADLQAIGNGETTITVSGNNGKSKSFEVVVNADAITVTYLNTKGGDILDTQSAYNYLMRGYQVPEVLKPPTRAGYTFDGWYVWDNYDSQEKEFNSETFFGTIYDTKLDDPSSGNSKATVYAKWTINKYTVKFLGDNDTELQTGEVEYGTTPSYNGETPTKDGYTFVGWEPEIATVTENVTYTAKWTPKVSAGDATYDTLNDALAQVEDKTDITVPDEVTLDDAGELTIPANSTITVADSASAGSGEAAASVKELTIAKDGTSETAYLVTVGGATSAVKSNDVDNVITGKDESGTAITTEAEAKAHVAQMFDVPKVLARIASTTNTAVNDVDFSMVVTQEGVTQRAGHDKTFEVHPVAKVGGNTYPVTATGELKAKEYNVTLDFGAANAGKYVKLTHYKSEGGTEDLGTPLIGEDGKVTCQMSSFSDVSGTIQPDEYGATFTLTVDAPESINVDTEFEVEVKLTSSVDTKLDAITFSYSLPEKFTETGKTGSLASATEQTGGTWLWNAASGGGVITLPKDTAVSLGKIKAKVAKADAEYDENKTFTFGPATLTFFGVAGTEKTTVSASDTTKVTTTYAITWDYNGGKLDNADNKTDTVGVNETPTAPAPVKPGYTLSWDKTTAKATEDTTYTAVWTLDTTDMSVVFKDYGYAYYKDTTDYDQLLVLKAPALDSGYAYAIDENLMFATTEANYRGLVSAAENEIVYVYLVSGTMTADDVLGTTPKLSVVAGTNTAIARDGDLYRDGSVKQGDLGVLVDLYIDRAVYGRTGVVDVRARLEADMDNTASTDNGFKSLEDINAIISKLFPAAGG